MKEFQNKRKIKKVTSSIWFSGILLIFTCILLSSVLGLYQKKRQVLKLSQESQTELAKLQEKTVRVTNQLETLDTTHGKEQMIREKYNIKTEGEGVIIVMDPELKEEGIPVVKKDIWYSTKEFFRKLFD
jgi:cell division protein FtsB